MRFIIIRYLLQHVHRSLDSQLGILVYPIYSP